MGEIKDNGVVIREIKSLNGCVLAKYAQSDEYGTF